MSSSQHPTKKSTYSLHIFPPTAPCYNISPFGIKLESFLRVNSIPYETVYTSQMGPKGQIPYINIKESGETIGDSNVIIEFLKRNHETTDINLTTEERAISHATIRMIEEHLAQIGFHYRYKLHLTELFESLDLSKLLFHADKFKKGELIAKIFQRVMPIRTGLKSYFRGFTRHSEKEIWGFSFEDLQALSDLLGNDKYFFGKDHPTKLDCTVFGHLVQFIDIPIDFPQKAFIKDHCPNLVEFVKHFKSQHWPDWELKCQRQPNAKLVAKWEKKEKKSSFKMMLGVGLMVSVGYYFWQQR